MKRRLLSRNFPEQNACPAFAFCRTSYFPKFLCIKNSAGHLYSALLQENPKFEARNPKQIQNSKSQIQNRFEFRISNFEFPAVALLVSGGHTELVLMNAHGKFKVIGETLDD